MTSSCDPYPKQLAWREGRAGLHVRPRYLHVVEDGALGRDEAAQLLAWVDAWARSAVRRRVLFDLRASRAASEPAIQDVRRRWLAAHPWLCQVAVASSSEGAIATFNLFGVADGVRARAFADLTEAHRWLCAPTATYAGDEDTATLRLRPASRLRDA